MSSSPCHCSALGRLTAALLDLTEVVRGAGAARVKVILETGALSGAEKAAACALAIAAGAAFVKTSTGFGAGGATVEDVALLRDLAGAARRGEGLRRDPHGRPGPADGPRWREPDRHERGRGDRRRRALITAWIADASSSWSPTALAAARSPTRRSTATRAPTPSAT